MGSLTSTPKTPQRQVVYAPAPVAATPAPTITPVPNAGIEAENVQQAAEKARKQSLFARNRGRFGTIATSLRGFLGEVKPNARKTLLGE